MGPRHSKPKIEYRDRYVMDPAVMKSMKELQTKLDFLEKKNQELNQHFLEMKKERDKMKEELSPEKFQQAEKDFFKKFLEYIEKHKQNFKKIEEIKNKRCMFIGPTSCGKSSLLNSLIGSRKCRVGVGETTMEPNAVAMIGDLELWDMPGNNDKISYLEFSNLMFLKQNVFVGIVYDNDPNSVLRIVQVCVALEIDFILIRNQVDKTNYSEEYDNIFENQPENETREEEIPKKKKEEIAFNYWKKEDKKKINEISNNSKYFKDLFFVSAKNKFKHLKLTKKKNEC